MAIAHVSPLTDLALPWLRHVKMPTMDRSEVTASPVPRVALVDPDPVFCYAFKYRARQNRVPVTNFDSVLTVQKSEKRGYDLAVINSDSLQEEEAWFANLLFRREGIPILLVGNNEPAFEAFARWPGEQVSFSSKAQSSEAILADALALYARTKKAPKQTPIQN